MGVFDNILGDKDKRNNDDLLAQIEELKAIVSQQNAELEVKAEYENSIISQQQEIEALNETISQLRAEIDYSTNSPDDDSEIATSEETEVEATTDELTSAIVDKLDAINSNITKIEEDTLEQIKKGLWEVARNDEMKRQMHNELQLYKEDVYATIAKPYLDSIISFYNELAEKLRVYKEKDATDYQALLDAVESHLGLIEDELTDRFDVAVIDVKVGDEFNPKIHNGRLTTDTDNPELNRTIAKIITNGFRNEKKERIYKRAEVVVYKLQLSADNNE